MKKLLPYYVSVLMFIWFGYVCAISFMEAPLKFQAPGITIALGLGIGRLVFQTLNKLEWVFFLLIGYSWFVQNFPKHLRWVMALLVVILAFQSFYLLPFLDARAQIYIDGKTPPPSSMHFVYIFTDALKIIVLFVGGNLQLKYLLQNR